MDQTQALNLVGLGGRLNLPAQFSGGEQQRVEIARRRQAPGGSSVRKGEMMPGSTKASDCALGEASNPLFSKEDRHSDRDNRANIANIRPIEYIGFIVQSILREYKANVFQALAHPTRIAILEVLREGEVSARAIQERLGVEQANLSQHLAVLRSREIVASRKEGNQVFYSLRNKVLIKVLELMRQYFQAHLHEAVQMLGEVRTERPAGARGKPGIRRRT